jgi:hypothetical protein
MKKSIDFLSEEILSVTPREILIKGDKNEEENKQ